MGSYLEEHKLYLTQEHLKRDTDFISQSLSLTKKDKCLDLQCAQGRLTIELTKRGFKIDGLDFSDYMLGIARSESEQANIDINFIKGDLNNLRLPRIYTKVALYFPDLDGINLDNFLLGVSRIMKSRGLFLYDQDNLFRIWDYLTKNSDSSFSFNPFTMELKEKRKRIGNRYYVFPELKNKFEKAGFKIVRVYGGWTIDDGEYKYNSSRLRIIAKKD